MVVYLSTIVSGLHLKVRFFHTKKKKICGTRFHIASRRVFKVPIILTFIKILIFLFTGRITTREWMIFFFIIFRCRYSRLIAIVIVLFFLKKYYYEYLLSIRWQIKNRDECTLQQTGSAKKNEKMKNNSVCLHFLMSVRFDLTIDYISLDIYLLYVLNQHKPFLVFQARLFRLFLKK